MKAGIVLDTWKRPIFERHLSQANYSYEVQGEATPGSLVITVITEDAEALGEVIRAAQIEAAKERR